MHVSLHSALSICLSVCVWWFVSFARYSWLFWFSFFFHISYQRRRDENESFESARLASPRLLGWDNLAHSRPKPAPELCLSRAFHVQMRWRWDSLEHVTRGRFSMCWEILLVLLVALLRCVHYWRMKRKYLFIVRVFCVRSVIKKRRGGRKEGRDNGQDSLGRPKYNEESAFKRENKGQNECAC